MTASRLLILVLTAITLFAAGVRVGIVAERNANEAERAEALDQGIVRHERKAAVGQATEKKRAARAARTEAVFDAIQQGVLDHAQQHPVPRPCLDDDGLRHWRAANAGADADATGEPDAAVPGDSAAAGERIRDGSPGESRGHDAQLSPLPGSAPGVGGLAGGDR